MCECVQNGASGVRKDVEWVHGRDMYQLSGAANFSKGLGKLPHDVACKLKLA